MHMETHPRCVQCGKRFLTQPHLTEHMARHKKFTCEICQKEVECQERESHVASHHRQELFKQTLDNGRIVGKLNLKVKSTPGYPLFLKTNYTKTREMHPELDSKQVKKLLAAEWKTLGPVGQQAYKTMAGSNSGEEQVQQQVQAQVQQQVQEQVTQQVQKQVAKQLQQHLTQQMQGAQTQGQRQRGQGAQTQGQRQRGQGRQHGQGQLTPDQDMPPFKKCHICGKLLTLHQDLKNHIETEVAFHHILLALIDTQNDSIQSLKFNDPFNISFPKLNSNHYSIQK